MAFTPPREPEGTIMGLEEAESHLSTAQKHLERVQNKANDTDGDPGEAVTWAFYAYENCISALAEAFGRRWTHDHVHKAELARTFYAEQLVSRDVGDLLEKLNRLRKDVEYGEPGSDLREVDLEDLSSDLERYIDEVESCVDAAR